MIAGVLCLNGTAPAQWYAQGSNGVTLKSGAHLHSQGPHDYHARFGGRSVTTKAILDGPEPFKIRLSTDSACPQGFSHRGSPHDVPLHACALFSL